MSDTTAYRFNELRYKLQNNQLVLSDLNVGDFYQLVTHIETKGQALTVLGSEYLRRTIVLLNQYMDDLEFDKNVFQRIDNDLDGTADSKFIVTDKTFRVDKTGRVFKNFHSGIGQFPISSTTRYTKNREGGKRLSRTVFPKEHFSFIAAPPYSPSPGLS